MLPARVHAQPVTRAGSIEPFAALRAASAPVALLHSCGRGPASWFDGAVDVLELPVAAFADAWRRIGGFLGRHRARHCVGWLGYDLRDATEPIARRVDDDVAAPLVHLVAYARRRDWPAAAVAPAPAVRRAREVRPHLSRSEYEAAVAAIVEHIRAGDVFQANLTQPFTGTFDGDPRALFWRLCEQSPAPFAAYLETADGTAVLSSSPEEFLRVDGARVRTRPIKGTRPRFADPAADRTALRELLASGKDRAELAMIVDLMRNDLGKVAATGSVRVGRFPDHVSAAQVHHLFAEVGATLRPEVTLTDLLRATFPAGSITGAPKLRCMELLEEYEVVRRGVYTGAIGWFGPGRRAHLSVAIRTMVVRGGRVRFNVGGGVTARSDPRLEYEETLHKAAGMLRALQAETDAP